MAGVNKPLAESRRVGWNAANLVFSTALARKGVPYPPFFCVHGGDRTGSLGGRRAIGLRLGTQAAHVGKSDHVVPSPGSNCSCELSPSNARNGCTKDQRYADRPEGNAASHCIGTTSTQEPLNAFRRGPVYVAVRNDQDTSGSICRYIDGPLGTGCLLPTVWGRESRLIALAELLRSSIRHQC